MVCKYYVIQCSADGSPPSLPALITPDGSIRKGSVWCGVYVVFPGRPNRFRIISSSIFYHVIS